jgi:hypothetical protein
MAAVDITISKENARRCGGRPFIARGHPGWKARLTEDLVPVTIGAVPGVEVLTGLSEDEVVIRADPGGDDENEIPRPR